MIVLLVNYYMTSKIVVETLELTTSKVTGGITNAIGEGIKSRQSNRSLKG